MSIPKEPAIIVNAIRCLKCQELIVSNYIHDFKWCPCGNVAVDGGKTYLKRSIAEGSDLNYVEESIVLDYALNKYRKAL
jgi:hypothetical protein